ncbi:hypothetical protein TNIN_62931 [Trichonephila inaurata madagascariensis]|uniref:Uncharacterized protein n=1 Tax=Trichonephila inaurata madagascariensis TaxID=2747483 RepID=A0A8X6XQU5_9ARAC|nr:hypothetical protein TNIN_62931 [Trichonephila inaurata madagascariensis]
MIFTYESRFCLVGDGNRILGEVLAAVSLISQYNVQKFTQPIEDPFLNSRLQSFIQQENGRPLIAVVFRACPQHVNILA